jgi:hypothetical protein
MLGIQVVAWDMCNIVAGVKPVYGIPTLPSVIPHKTTYTYSYILEYIQSPNTDRRNIQLPFLLK